MGTDPKLTDVGVAESVPLEIIVPVTLALTLSVALATVRIAETAVAAAPAAGVSLRPTVQVSPLFSVALAAQALLEMVMFVAGVTDTSRGPGGAAPQFGTVNTTSVPDAPGATEPRSGPPEMVSKLGRLRMPLRATLATEAPGPLSVIVNVAVSVTVAVAAGANTMVTAQVALEASVTMLHVSEVILKSAGVSTERGTRIWPVVIPPVLPTLMTSGALVAPGAATSEPAVGVAPSLARVSTLAVTETGLVTPPWEIMMASPVGTPAVAEEKSTTTVQVCPAARVAVQVEAASILTSAPCTPVVRPVSAD